jgi:hypothetical protein
MDPITNLKKQLEVACDIQAVVEACDGTLTTAQQDHMTTLAIHLSELVLTFWVKDVEKGTDQWTQHLAELVLALNEWMSKGGFSRTNEHDIQ